MYVYIHYADKSDQHLETAGVTLTHMPDKMISTTSTLTKRNTFCLTWSGHQCISQNLWINGKQFRGFPFTINDCKIQINLHSIWMIGELSHSSGINCGVAVSIQGSYVRQPLDVRIIRISASQYKSVLCDSSRDSSPFYSDSDSSPVFFFHLDLDSDSDSEIVTRARVTPESKQ